MASFQDLLETRELSGIPRTDHEKADKFPNCQTQETRLVLRSVVFSLNLRFIPSVSSEGNRKQTLKKNNEWEKIHSVLIAPERQNDIETRMYIFYSQAQHYVSCFVQKFGDHFIPGTQFPNFSQTLTDLLIIFSGSNFQMYLLVVSKQFQNKLPKTGISLKK